MTALDTHRIVARVILEVGGTIATNGIQELHHTERGGVSTFGYVRGCLYSTAYNGVRELPNFNMSYDDFCKAVDAETDARMDHCDDCGGVLPDGCICDPMNDAVPDCESCGCNDGTCQHAA